MEPREFPILDFDPDKNAVINAWDHKPRLLENGRAVLCFFREAIAKALDTYPSRLLYTSRSEANDVLSYEIEYKGEKLVLAQALVGAPMAAGQIEELAVLGCDKIVACGGCGVLRKDIAAGHLMIPISAVRDEGTSYHYAPPSREIEADADVARVIAHTIQAYDIPYIEVKTWTTDAFFRETKALVEQRRQEGCVAVEMETAAFIATSRFRGVKFGQILYAGDNLDGEAWDGRDWYRREDVRWRLLHIALDACLNIR